jgi:hypothetical protein
MPLPPPPSDTEAATPGKPDTSADARVRAHMIGAPGAPAPATRPLLVRLGRWLLQRLPPRR